MSPCAVLNVLERIGCLVEDVLTVGLLGLMIILASLQIVLRIILDFGFIWGDELLRIMVLWVAMAGAVAASRADRHISIDVLSRFLPDRVNALVKALTDVFTASVCGLAAYYSWRFVSMEIEFESMILGGVPAWPFQAVLPIGFALISWRYILHAVKSVTRTVAPSLEGGGT